MCKIYLAWLELLLPLAALAWAAPVPPPANKLEARIREIRRSGANGRVNGAKLEFTPAVVGEELRLRWSLDYTGPRPPLIIVKPSLTTPGSMTFVTVYALRKDGEVGEAFLGAPMPPGIVMLREEDFLWAEEGKPPTGTFTISLAEVRKRWADRYPGEFAYLPAEFYVGLSHRPSDRGGRYNLDAWTGNLQGPPVKITTSKR